MKYMGSKRAMLLNGLGALIREELKSSTRFVDLFTGSGAVAWSAATNHDVEVHAYDLQDYGAALARAVVARTHAVDGELLWSKWSSAAAEVIGRRRIPHAETLTQKIVANSREWAGRQQSMHVTRAYGGHYFSPRQAMWIDALRMTLPNDSHTRAVALGALIQAASECAAAPGHTAQPFQPTRTAKRFLQEAWNRDLPARTTRAVNVLCKLHARTKGKASRMDANDAACTLTKGDLVFVDPPYSGVHYSRFYHVLETIARGECGDVTGVGRYPSQAERPRSRYSVASESGHALTSLLETLAARETTVILTFPDHECSNGLSGQDVREIAQRYFDLTEASVKSRFSTLGGVGEAATVGASRAARHHANELILLLKPAGKKN